MLVFVFVFVVVWLSVCVLVIVCWGPRLPTAIWHLLLRSGAAEGERKEARRGLSLRT